MAENNEVKTSAEINRRNRTNRQISGTINGLLHQIGAASYGAAESDDVSYLNSVFNDLLKNETDKLNRTGRSDTASFISNLYKDTKITGFQDADTVAQLNNIFDDSSNEGTIQSYITDQYRNRLLKQADLHEVASQLIELREAILIVRDAICASDIVEGKMSRILKFSETGNNHPEDLIPIVESMEKKFKLQDKIKNFIVPKTLEYGEYYVYLIPYSKVFGDFMKIKDQHSLGFNMYRESTGTGSLFTETTLKDFIESTNDEEFSKDLQHIFESSVYIDENDLQKTSVISKTDNSKSKESIFKEYTDYVDSLMEHVTICNDPLPINILEEGVESAEFFTEKFLDEEFNEKVDINVSNIGTDNYFNQVMKSDYDAGTYAAGTGGNRSKRDTTDTRYDKMFLNIHDCYMKVIDPIHLIPVKIMTKTIGYYYVKCEEIAPETGVVSSSLYYNRFEDTRRNGTLVDSIADRIVKCFNKEFLRKNEKFKDLIVEALQYFNLNEQRVRFQFIPAEYIVAHKVQEDENGDGTSILEPSLFYAKLYLMLLLFNIMSIILYSNDQRINYVRTSGIDKNVRRKIEEIARIKQQRSITVMDLFSYTSLVNKLGVGAETYIPTGRSNERGIETEVIQGQDVNLNNDFMNDLRKSYILGTGVPDAIINYMNEADFAKSIEMANTRFMGRIVSYQMDFNATITEMYKKLMAWSTNIDSTDIETFEFSFAQSKAGNNQIRSDLVQNFDAFATWCAGMMVGTANVDNPENTDTVNAFKFNLAKEYLPMINFDQIKELYKKASVDGLETTLKPKGKDSEEEEDLAGL